MQPFRMHRYAKAYIRKNVRKNKSPTNAETEEIK